MLSLVSECNNRICAHNELYRFWSYSPSLWRPRRPRFSSEYFTEMLLSEISRPSMVKYCILKNSRHSKRHAVIDCQFFFYPIWMQPIVHCLSYVINYLSCFIHFINSYFLLDSDVKWNIVNLFFYRLHILYFTNLFCSYEF